MSDFVLAAFAPFFMQSPSFLAHQRFLETGQGRHNCQTLFGVDKIPCDNQIRAMLDPVEPTCFYPMFADIMAELQQSGSLDAMRCLGGHMLIALDGTGPSQVWGSGGNRHWRLCIVGWVEPLSVA